MKFILFKRSLEEGAKPVYLFDGEEEYFKERGEAMLREKYLAEPSLDFSLFRGETLHGGALADLVAAEMLAQLGVTEMNFSSRKVEAVLSVNDSTLKAM